MRTRRQIDLSHRCSHQTLTILRKLTKLSYLPDSHIRVEDDVGYLLFRELLWPNIAQGSCMGSNYYIDSPTLYPFRLMQNVVPPKNSLDPMPGHCTENMICLMN